MEQGDRNLHQGQTRISLIHNHRRRRTPSMIVTVEEGTKTTARRAPKGIIFKIVELLKEDPLIQNSSVMSIFGCSYNTVWRARCILRDGEKPLAITKEEKKDSNLEEFLKLTLKTFSPEKAIKIISSVLQ